MSATATLAAPRTIPKVTPKNAIIGDLGEFRKNRFAWQIRIAREFPDIARVRIGFFRPVLISSPELIGEVLALHHDAFVKSQGLSIFARPLLGNGLLTSEHDFHTRQRRLMAPAFAPKRIAAYADVMSERAQKSAARILSAKEVDVAAETMRVTLEIVGKTLFDAEVGEEAGEIGEALTQTMKNMMRMLTSIVPIPPKIPTPGNRRAMRAVARLDETIFRLIRERRAQGGDRGDVLSMLLAAQDEDGTCMNDTQVRDEAMTLFLAGHETTANGLAWSLYLLAKNPSARIRAEEEVDRLRGRAPAMSDLKQLPYTLQIFKEAMRLYPPAYIMGRRAERDVTIGGHVLRKNQIVFLNIAGIHRRPDLWADPDVFDPDRFEGEKEKSLPKFAYMPFGGGPRICIGNHFALMEAQILLATYLQHARFETAVDPRPETLITLRPKGGIPMRVTPR